MHSVSKNILHRFFAGVVEFTFCSRLGVVDPPLVDYVSDLLVRFVRNDVIYKIRDLRGRPVLQVVEMLAEAEKRIGDARREVFRHIGDYTLFWVGLYPESLRCKQGSVHLDHLVNYQKEGKRSYLIASMIDTEADGPASAGILERLSQEFELCAYGLGEVRREWERKNDVRSDMFFIN